MIIKILGPGCTNCQQLEQRARQAVEDLGVDAEILEVTDYADIMAFGIMSTPALVVNGEIRIAGRVPSTDEIASILSKSLS
ncbi:MAG: thioredoxin family protein [Coriobacteriia bacterium]|nr:thioredoxin family protein [Coriobacteriia bacterium]